MGSPQRQDADSPIEAQIVGPAPTPSVNPYVAPPAPPQQDKPPSSLDEYHKVADVAAGLNFRWRDNLYQGLAILAFILVDFPIGAGVAWLSGVHPAGGAILGGFGGLVLGFLVSGLVLMVYRMFRH